MTTPRKPPTDPDQALTVRLGEDGERTARLAPAAALAPAAPADDVASATVLDPAAWATPAVPPPAAPRSPAASQPVDATRPLDAPSPFDAGHPPAASGPGTDTPQDERPLAEGEVLRIGPGVPAVAAAVWHGEVEPDRPVRRKGRRRLLAVVLLAALLALLAWRWYTPPLAVTGVTVATDPAGPRCGGTAVVTATASTNGHAGTVRYRWVRSDGTASGELSQSVPAGSRREDLVLRWTFDGHGSMQATATVEILSPGRHTAAAAFTYSCP